MADDKKTVADFGNMLKTDYGTFVQIGTLAASLDKMRPRIKKHIEAVAAQEKVQGKYVAGKWKGRYGDFATLNDALYFFKAYNDGVKTLAEVKLSYNKRQTAYENSAALRASKVIGKAQGALVEKTKSIIARIKSFSLSGTDDGLGLEPFTTAALIIGGVAVSIAAIVVMKGFILEYMRPTIADAGMIAKSIAGVQDAADKEEQAAIRLKAESKEARDKGDYQKSVELDLMAKEKEKNASALRKEATDAFATQQQADIDKRSKDGKSLFENIGENAGKVVAALALAAGGYILFENREKFLGKTKVKTV